MVALHDFGRFFLFLWVNPNQFNVRSILVEDRVSLIMNHRLVHRVYVDH